MRWVYYSFAGAYRLTYTGSGPVRRARMN